MIIFEKIQNRPLRLLPRLICALLLCLVSISGWALNGPDTARQLNQRLAATPAQCVGGNPVYACSGVLVLPMSEGHPQPFWHHDAEAEARGTERFQFLRRDGFTGPLPGNVGYILYDRFTAIGQGKAYDVVTDGGGAPGDVMVRNWDKDQPQSLAVQALYYDISQPDSLLRAQRGQREYFDATGDWLPLVRFAPGDADALFGFATQEQLYSGYQVADRLNARYARTSPTCADGGAAYRCNGVLLRTTDVGNFHAWDPSPISVKGNGVSFMYFRADLKTVRFYKAQGFVVRELSYPVAQPLSLRCIFPFDAHTGGSVDYCNFRPSCASRGITSVAAWDAAYVSAPHTSCFFDNSAGEYQLALDIRNQSGAPSPYHWSELIIAAWPSNVGEQLPLEAFVYSAGAGLSGAKGFQLDYLNTHRRYLPVLEVVPDAADGRPFVFKPEDQSIE
ncbi:hypothetical protein [Pseudomonas sp. Marseille-P9899]|uniref:hypothetical protein n=1 Tax=Pseudomonas sp. Marseille-P9899 TaxID=2730401 RepID=UPI00158A6B98|nr:hypothetical protein [Pseudomonas sp. Marseille-P9899]